MDQPTIHSSSDDYWEAREAHKRRYRVALIIAILILFPLLGMLL